MIERIIKTFKAQLNGEEIIGTMNNPRLLWLLTVMLELIYVFPLLFFGENARVKVYDNLDIVIPLNKMLVDSGMMFASSNTIVPNMMGGLPRFLYGSELNGYAWLFYFFQPFTAYVINETLMHVAGLLSMLVLLQAHFIPRETENRNFIIFSVAILFSLVPFYTGSGLSVPLLPLALYAFLNIRRGDTGWKNWLIIVSIPFYSSLVLVYFFFLLVMSGLFLVDWVRSKRFDFSFFLAMGIMSVMYLIVEHHLVYGMFFNPDFVSHRVEFDLAQTLTPFETLKRGHGAFLLGLQNMQSPSSSYILPTVMLAMVMTLFRDRLGTYTSFAVVAVFLGSLYSHEYWQYVTGGKYTIPLLVLAAIFLLYKRPEYRLLSGLLLLQIFFSFWYAMWFNDSMNMLARYLPIVKEFNFARVAYLQPALWFVILAVALKVLTEKVRFALLLMAGLLVYQTILELNIRQFSAKKDALSYKSYYAEKLFADIKAYIGKDPSTYRVGSLLIHPVIALYNGFYTIDGYIPSYPLSYKKRFREVIARPLERASFEDRALYDSWGSKCYLFDGDLPPLLYKKEEVVHKLSLDFRAFYELGGRYLISSHEIDPSLLKEITFQKKFTDEDTYWNIFLYKVDENQTYQDR